MVGQPGADGSNAYVAPVAVTPLSQQGHSLQTGMLTADLGLITNISLLDRPNTAARVLDNLQQLVPGIWTSSNIGWQPQRAGVFNSGASFLEFSFFIDNSGNRTLLFQVGSVLYSYNLGTSTETSILTGLNTSAIPCIRRSYSQLTAQSIAMYCSSTTQPQKITSVSAASAANFNQIFPNLAPTGLNVVTAGTAGATTYSYALQTVYSNGTTSILTVNTSIYTGNATLNGTNYNTIQWIPVPNATAYNVYRTVSGGAPASVGIIGTSITGTLTTNSQGNTVLSFNDTGIAGTGTANQVPGSVSVTTTGANVNCLWGYAVAAVFANGAQTVSGNAILVAGPANLTGGATNVITWTAVTGAIQYKIYRTFVNVTYDGLGRTGLPNSLGFIGASGPSTLTFTDTGITGDGSTAQNLNPLTVNIQGTWGNTGPYFGNFNVTNNSGKIYNQPKFCEPVGTRMVYGGFSAASTAFDVIISDANNVEQFSVHSPGLATDSVAFSYPPTLGALTGIKTMRLSNQTNQTIIIGGCTNGMWMITGTDATSFAMFTLTEEIGVLSNRTWVQISNDMYFLSTVGIRNFSSLANNAILTPDEVSKNIHDLMANIDLTNAANSFAVHHPATQEIQFWYPYAGVDNGVPGHAFIANYNAVGSTATGNVGGIKWSTRSGTAITCGIDFLNVMYGGGSGGLLQQHYNGNTYNGSAMLFSLATAMITMPFPLQKCSLKDVQIITEGNAQNFPLLAYFNRKMSDKSWQRIPALPNNYVAVSGNPPQTILGSWSLGFSAFPGLINKLVGYQYEGNGNFWDFEVTSSSASNSMDFEALAYIISGGGLER